jgi:3-hydroxyacyl-CoA dehydrogenase
MGFDRVGVVGAGVMGAGVAQNLAETRKSGRPDIDESQLQKARSSIRL